jgi:hypothetical protein
MLGMFKKRKAFGDAEKNEFVAVVSGLLELQLVMTEGYSIEREGSLNRKALGYVYGFIDAALTSIGQNMSEISIGIPVTYQVLRRLFPGQEEKCLQFLVDRIGKDQVVMLGAMKGGQQFVDARNPGAVGHPMGLARYIIEGDMR